MLVWAFVPAALLFAACDRDGPPDLCERAVRHMAVGLIPEGADQPDEGERRIMESVTRASIHTCRKEGLSQAQADCILAVESVDDLLYLGRCPAIAKDKPTWLTVPSEADLKQLEKAKTSGDESSGPDGP